MQERLSKKAKAAKVVELVRQLPVMTQTVNRLLETECQAGEKREAILEMAANDSGLCADMLFMANSSCFGNVSRRAAETAQEAWELIDTEALCMQVASTAVNENLRRAFMDESLWLGYVAHSLAISRSSHILAGLLGKPRDECDRFSVAGLMHDIGRVIIMIAVDNRNASLLGTSPELMGQVIHDEKEAYSLNHCEVGELLYRNWHFSPIMQEGILRHHTPLLKDEFSLPGAIIFLAHFVTMSDFTGDIIANMLGQKLLDHIGIDAVGLKEAKRLYEKSGKLK